MAAVDQTPDTPQSEGPNELYEARDKQFVYDRKLEAAKEYAKEQTNGALGDPTARRNIGANGYTQRTGQKDQLENLRIGGDEVTGQGGHDHDTPGERAAGPGFEAEGSVDLGSPTRSREQEFGDKLPSGPSHKAQE